MKSPKATATTSASKRANVPAAFGLCLISGIRNLRCWGLRVATGSAHSMQQCKHRGNKDERGHRGAKQAADNRGAERGVFLASITQTESHRDHADDHGESGHQNWPKTREAGLDGGLQRVSESRQALGGKCHHENTVRSSHAHAHYCAHECGHTERSVRSKQEDDNAG